MLCAATTCGGYKYCLHKWRYLLQHTTTYCNVLQHAATHCRTLQHTATHCNTLQHTAAHCNTRRLTAKHCNTLQHTAKTTYIGDVMRADGGPVFCPATKWAGSTMFVNKAVSCCSVLQCVAVCCSVLQCVAVCCSMSVWHRSGQEAACS